MYMQSMYTSIKAHYIDYEVEWYTQEEKDEET